MRPHRFFVRLSWVRASPALAQVSSLQARRFGAGLPFAFAGALAAGFACYLLGRGCSLGCFLDRSEQATPSSPPGPVQALAFAGSGAWRRAAIAFAGAAFDCRCGIRLLQQSCFGRRGLWFRRWLGCRRAFAGSLQPWLEQRGLYPLGASAAFLPRFGSRLFVLFVLACFLVFYLAFAFLVAEIEFRQPEICRSVVVAANIIEIGLVLIGCLVLILEGALLDLGFRATLCARTLDGDLRRRRRRREWFEKGACLFRRGEVARRSVPGRSSR